MVRRFMGKKVDKNIVSLFHCNDTNGTDAKGFATVQSKNLATVSGKFGNANVGYVKYQPDQWKNLILNSEWTIDFWLCPMTKNDWQVTLYLGGDDRGTATLRMQIDSSRNTIVFWLSNGGGWLVDGSNVSIKLSQWQHVAWVYSKSTGIIMLFIDGVKKYSCAFAPYATPGQHYNIGAGWSSNIDDNSYRDEIRFSNVARWASNFTPPTRPY